MVFIKINIFTIDLELILKTNYKAYNLNFIFMQIKFQWRVQDLFKQGQKKILGGAKKHSGGTEFIE